MSSPRFDAIVVGEGAAGLAVAGHLAAAGLATATIERELFGGLVANVNVLDPSPAAAGVSGSEWASELASRNHDAGVRSIAAAVESVTGAADAFEVLTPDATYGARQIVVASGARLRTMEVVDAVALEGRGVSTCADCDGPLFRGQPVVVIGGGDSAVQQALTLSAYCSKVYLVLRGTRLRARPDAVRKLRDEPLIEIVTNAVLERIEARNAVDAVHLRCASDSTSRRIPCAGVFPFIGLVAATQWLPPSVSRDADGFVHADSALETTHPGIWVAGAATHGFAGSLTDALQDAHLVARGVVARSV